MGVALLALFLFIGGGAYIFLSTPPTQQDPNGGLIGANATPTSSLAVFVQETPSGEPTPAPTPTPFFFSIDPGSPSPSDSAFPSFSFPVGPTPTPTQVVGPTPTATHTQRPTPTPTKKPTPTPTQTTKPTPTPTNNPTPTPAPKAKFTWTQTTGLTVKFTNTSKNATSYTWDFGDGGSSTKTSPSHPYGSAGDYSVTLTAAGPGGTNQASQTVHVDAGPPPGPTAKAQCGSPDANNTVHCDGTGSTGDNLSYQWSGDGNPSSPTSAQTDIDFPDGPGEYNVTLTVSNGDGSNSDTVHISIGSGPVAGEAAIEPLALALFGLALPLLRRRSWTSKRA